MAYITNPISKPVMTCMIKTYEIVGFKNCQYELP